MFRKLTYMLTNDRQNLMALLVVLLIAVVLLFVLRDDEKPTTDSGNAGAASTQRHSHHPRYYAQPSQHITLTTFDPNTADSTQLLALGLQPWQVRAIYRYRAAGGVYTCPEDFARLYGLSAKKYRELRPYIRISDDYRPASEVYGRRHQTLQATNSQQQTTNSYPSTPTTHHLTTTTQHPTPTTQHKLAAGETLNINAADTTALCRIPGIGPYFARRIARYRERLGGFVTSRQLLEIEGFPESALPYFDDTHTTGNIRKLNLNTATSEQLRRHPYITYIMARDITEYRRQKGRITSLSDLRLLPSFPKETIDRLRPYVEY